MQCVDDVISMFALQPCDYKIIIDQFVLKNTFTHWFCAEV